MALCRQRIILFRELISFRAADCGTAPDTARNPTGAHSGSRTRNRSARDNVCQTRFKTSHWVWPIGRPGLPCWVKCAPLNRFEMLGLGISTSSHPWLRQPRRGRLRIAAVSPGALSQLTNCAILSLLIGGRVVHSRVQTAHVCGQFLRLTNGVKLNYKDSRG
jgi:hypothetical protein